MNPPSTSVTPLLRRLRVEGFKSIAALDIELRPLNVLIGANGAGKSNFIEVFHFMREVSEQRFQRYVGQKGAEWILHYGSRYTQELKLHFDFGSVGYDVAFIANDQDRLLFASEAVYFASVEGPRTIKRTESFAAETEMGFFLVNYGGEETALNTVRTWRVYDFQDTTSTARVKKTSRLHDNAFLFGDAGNLAAFLYLLQQRHTAHFARIERTIQQVLPDFGGFELQPNPLNPDTIQLEWRERNMPDYLFKAADFSDGSLRFVCLATLLLQPDLPSVLLLDEPELGLHPAAVVILGGLLRKAAQRTTVIVSTQSAALVSAFEPADIIVVDRHEGASTFRRLEEEPLREWLERYSLGELWEKNVLNGGNP